MGNRSGKEDRENSGGDPSVRSIGGGGGGGGADRIGKRTNSVDSMENTPPGSPGRCKSPLLFSAQVPLAPLEKMADRLNLDEPWVGDSLDLPPQKAIPTLITWNCGGKDVTVEGSWDNWGSRRALHKSGKDYSILLVLPSGVYNYRFIVDGERRYIPNLPHVSSETGDCSNLLNVTDYIPENLDSIAEFEVPSSPDSSYSTSYLVDDELAKEPPAVPQQLHLSIIGRENDEGFLKPQHVVLDHLFIEKGGASQSLVALGLTHRFLSKYVTVVLYKPLRRQK